MYVWVMDYDRICFNLRNFTFGLSTIASFQGHGCIGRNHVPYAQRNPGFLFKETRGLPWEVWYITSTIEGSMLRLNDVGD